MKLESKAFRFITLLFTLTTASVSVIGHAQLAPPRLWVGASHTLAAYATAFSPDGSNLLSGSYDQTLKLWRASDGALLRTFTGHTASVGTVAYSSDNSTIASGSADLTIKLWRASDGILLRTLSGHTGNVRSVAFSPDGTLLVSGAQDNTVRLWRVSDGSLLLTLAGHGNWVASVAFSPDGTKIASASYDHTVRLWRVSDGALLAVLNHNNYVLGVAFSPDGSAVASGSADLIARVWRVSDGAVLGTLTGFNNWVWSVAFSPDGGTLLTTDNNAVIKLWNLSSGALVQSYQETALVTKAEFSPNGAQIGYGRADYMVVLAQNPLLGDTLPTLDVLTATDKQTYVNKDTATILVSVTDGVNPSAGAVVSASVTSPNGTHTNYSASTGANGIATFAYKINSKLGTGTYQVNASVCKNGCNSGGDGATFLVTK